MVSAVLDGDEIRGIGVRQQRHFSLSLAAAIALHLLLALVWAGIEYKRTTPSPLLPEPPVIRATFVTPPAPLPMAAKQEPESTPVTPPPRNSANQPAPQQALTPQKTALQPQPTSAPQNMEPQPLNSAAAPQQVAMVAEQHTAEINNKPALAPPAPQVKEVGMVQEAYVPPSSQIAYGNNPKPHYPHAAKRRGMEGVVELLVQVNEKGMVVDIELKHSSGFSVLDREALKAVAQWRFQPALLGGLAVAGEVVVPVRFQLDGTP